MPTCTVMLPELSSRSTASRYRGSMAQLALLPAVHSPRLKGTAWPRRTPCTIAKATLDLSAPHSIKADQPELKTRLAAQQILGANIPWKNCGWDYGYTYWNSTPNYPNPGYDAQFFEDAFATLQRMGGNTARLWLFFDGRSAPQFGDTPNTYNTVLSLQRPLKQGGNTSHTFLGDFLDMLKRAHTHDIRVIPTLWSFEAMNYHDDNDTQFSGSHEGLFEVSENADAFVNNALIPLLNGVEAAGLTSTILAWDIINEPEWAIQEAGQAWPKAPKVSLAQMQRFVGKCAAAIHRKGALATVGSARTSWNWENAQTAQELSTQALPLTNFWGDADLKKAAGDDLAYLDLYQVHYYDSNMKTHNPTDVFEYPAAKLISSEKPILLGEIPGKYMPNMSQQDCDARARARVEWCKTNGYAGILFWSYDNGHIAQGTVISPNTPVISESDGFGDYQYFRDAFNSVPLNASTADS